MAGFLDDSRDSSSGRREITPLPNSMRVGSVKLKFFRISIGALLR
jgi:hypothetical protein